jgi:hypothetical protein
VSPEFKNPNDVIGVLFEDTCHAEAVLLSTVINMQPERFVMLAIDPLQSDAVTPDAAGKLYPFTATASTIVAPDLTM